MLANWVARIARSYGAETVLRVFLSYSLNVAIVAVNLPSARRQVEHALTLVHRINLVCRAFGKSLMSSWRDRRYGNRPSERGPLARPGCLDELWK
jgi:hypothetical protein